MLSSLQKVLIFIVAALIAKVLFKQLLLYNGLNITINKVSTFQMINT